VLLLVPGPAFGDTVEFLYAGLPLDSTPNVAERWCDFAKHAASWQRVPVEEDPVFRQPSPRGKADFAAAAKYPKGALDASIDHVFVRAFSFPDGPALGRLAVTHADPEVRRRGWIAAEGTLMQQHPRLAGLGVDDLSARFQAWNGGFSLAEAAAVAFLSTRCDTPSLYALDVLDAPDAAHTVLLRLLFHDALDRRPDIGLVRRLLAWVAQAPRKLSSERAFAVELVGDRGWLPEADTLARLSADADPAVAAAALLALARAHPHAAADRARALLTKVPSKPSALHRAAVHALALADPMGPRTEVVLEQLAKKGSPLRNEAELALAYVRLD
jgi:hypothetical protein